MGGRPQLTVVQRTPSPISRCSDFSPSNPMTISDVISRYGGRPVRFREKRAVLDLEILPHEEVRFGKWYCRTSDFVETSTYVID
jgi:hypothetical protein